MSRRHQQLPLPLFSHAVFFDWFGTLSTSRFWETITDSSTHPLTGRLKPAVDELFTGRRDLLAAWMRGIASDEEVCQALNVELPQNYLPDFLHRALLADCRSATVDPMLMGLASIIRSYAYLAVASDNMECFAEAPPAILCHGLRVDGLLVSSDIGALKAEDPHAFFGPFLRQRQLGFEQALLIDDCATTCATFHDLGGAAIHYQSPEHLRIALTEWAPTPRLRQDLLEAGDVPRAVVSDGRTAEVASLVNRRDQVAQPFMDDGLCCL